MFKNLKYFLPYIKRYKYYIIISTLALVIGNFIDIKLQLVLGKGIDAIKIDKSSEKLWSIVLLYILLLIGQMFFRYWMRGFHIASFKVARDLRKEFLQHLLKLPPPYFDKAKTGDIMARATTDIEAVRMLFEPAMFIGFDVIIYFILVPPQLFAISSQLALYSLVLFPVLPFFVNYMGGLIHKKFKENQEILAQISAKVQENVSGIIVVKSFALENSKDKDFGHINRLYKKKSLSLAKIATIFEPTLRFSVGFSIFLVILIGGAQVIYGKITIGDFVAFQSLLMRILWPMIGIGWIIPIVQRSTASMKRLQEVFKNLPHVSEDEDTIAPEESLKGAIQIKNLTFFHQGSSIPTLQNLTLNIKPGEKIAIFGPVGSGKSTILNLLTRLYEPQKGSIIIDNYDIKKLSLRYLRNNISYISQDAFLFSESIEDNLKLGSDTTDIEEIKKIMYVAEISSLLDEKIGGLSAPLGERGINLSGGQKQRLNIVRGLLKKANIYLLDDPFSNVDYETEEKILKRLDKILREKTCVFVSHRISLAEHVDRIIFFEDGKILEYGTHEELIKQQGKYYDFYRYQKIRTELNSL